MKPIDPHKVESYLRDVAEARIIPRFQNLADHEISSKTNPNDLVTIADQEAEEDLTKIFKDLLPGSYVVGEEAVSQGTAQIDALKDHDTPVWVVDPVDGTGNFSRGEPVYGLMAALVHKQKTVQGWIYDIPQNRMGIAESGAGCFINQTRQSIAPLTQEQTAFEHLRAYIAVGFVPKSMRPDILPKLESFKDYKTLNCCAHEYLNLVEGQKDFSFYKRMKPWDHLPGLLLYAEAGGYSRSWDGTEHMLYEDQTGIINAPSKVLFEQLQTFLLPPELQERIKR